MPQYMIFLGRMGANQIVWEAQENPIGVFEADTPQEACLKASVKRSVMGAFFAVEGTFWGTKPGELGKSFGERDTVDDKLTQMIEATKAQLEMERARYARELPRHSG